MAKDREHVQFGHDVCISMPGGSATYDLDESRQAQIDVRRLAVELGCSIKSLLALDVNNDPFNVELPYRRRDAEWITELWRSMNVPLGVHTRRIHYRLVSLPVPVLFPNGKPYENTRKCAHYLDRAVRDAIYLDLIPPDAIVDNKNPRPLIFLAEGTPADVDILENDCPDLSVYSGDLPYIPRLPGLPHLSDLPTARLLTPPTVVQRYHVEIWCEKSTMNDILLPLGRQYGVNIVTGTGDLSATACRNMVDRAERSGRPGVRILYLSDFDPGGDSMPVGVARKIEFELEKRGLNLDVQVRPVALIHDQCAELGLPRIPTKDGDTRAPGFEARFGDGATELDALEAIHPGKLSEILTAEVKRYTDLTLDRRVREAASEVDADLARLNAEIASDYRIEIQALEAEREKIQQELDEIHEEFERAVQRLAASVAERVKPLWAQAEPIFEHAADVCRRACTSLKEKMPDLGAVEWPTAAIGDEDPDPLFDSRRDYLDQLERYKRHQNQGRKT